MHVYGQVLNPHALKHACLMLTQVVYMYALSHICTAQTGTQTKTQPIRMLPVWIMKSPTPANIFVSISCRGINTAETHHSTKVGSIQYSTASGSTG